MQVVNIIFDGEVSWKPAALETRNDTEEKNQQESSRYKSQTANITHTSFSIINHLLLLQHFSTHFTQ